MKAKCLIVTALLSIALVFGSAASAQAAVSEGAGAKLTRGVINIGLGWFEVFNQIGQVSRDHNPALGASLGTLKGLGMTLARAGSGIFDVITFPLEPYDQPLVSPDYVWGASGGAEAQSMAEPQP